MELFSIIHHLPNKKYNGMLLTFDMIVEELTEEHDEHEDMAVLEVETVKVSSLKLNSYNCEREKIYNNAIRNMLLLLR